MVVPGALNADGLDERIDVDDDALIQSVEPMALLVGEAQCGARCQREGRLLAGTGIVAR